MFCVWCITSTPHQAGITELARPPAPAQARDHRAELQQAEAAAAALQADARAVLQQQAAQLAAAAAEGRRLQERVQQEEQVPSAPLGPPCVRWHGNASSSIPCGAICRPILPILPEVPVLPILPILPIASRPMRLRATYRIRAHSSAMTWSWSTRLLRLPREPTWLGGEPPSELLVTSSCNGIYLQQAEAAVVKAATLCGPSSSVHVASVPARLGLASRHLRGAWNSSRRQVGGGGHRSCWPAGEGGGGGGSGAGARAQQGAAVGLGAHYSGHQDARPGGGPR